jgi:hypothetical protein
MSSTISSEQIGQRSLLKAELYMALRSCSPTSIVQSRLVRRCPGARNRRRHALPAAYSTTVSLIAMILPITDDLVLRVKTRGVTVDSFLAWQMPLLRAGCTVLDVPQVGAKR